MKKIKLRIAQIAPLTERVPPKKYGGTERIVHTLTEELVKRGHQVTLFASGDSITSAKLISIYNRGLREAKIKDPYGALEWSLTNIINAYHMQDKFDIIHDHNSLLSLTTAEFVEKPVVITIHGPITPNNKTLYESITKPNLIAISKSQIRHSPNLKVKEVIYNGLNMQHYPFGAKHGGYLLFVGRISLEKGTHYAIEVAQTLNLPLIIAAKLDEVDKEYFKEYIQPRLDDEQIKWVGEVDENERNKLMSKAICILHPINWREPFGLTMIEAMACGCPVVAFNRGSVPEIIVDKKTGFIVNDVDEMIEAVKKIDQIDRLNCRKYALKKFNAVKMAESYETVYLKILNLLS